MNCGFNEHSLCSVVRKPAGIAVGCGFNVLSSLCSVVAKPAGMAVGCGFNVMSTACVLWRGSQESLWGVGSM